MSWQFFTFLSVLGISTSIVLQRILIHKDKLDPIAYAIFFQGLVGLVLLAYVVLVGFRLPDLSGLWLPAIAAFFLYGSGHIMYARTLQLVEASVFSVLFASSAIWVMLFGILLFDESLTIFQIIGAVLIFASIGLSAGIKKRFSLNQGTARGLYTGFIFGLAITSWSYVGRNTDTLSWSMASFLGASAAAFLMRPKSVSKFKSFTTSQIFPKLLLLSVLYAIAATAMLYAFKKGSLSVVSPLRQTSIIVTALLAILIIPVERNHIARKLSAAVISMVGVILLVS